ncbi:MAG: molybdopterin cofactor-binding domain-containing protein [Deinococcales bacterium]
MVKNAYKQRIQLFSDGFYRTPALFYDAKTMKGKTFSLLAYGAAATEVEVDGLSGAYRIKRVDILHDVGDSLSPLIDLESGRGAVLCRGWAGSLWRICAGMMRSHQYPQRLDL